MLENADVFNFQGQARFRGERPRLREGAREQSGGRSACGHAQGMLLVVGFGVHVHIHLFLSGNGGGPQTRGCGDETDSKGLWKNTNPQS